MKRPINPLMTHLAVADLGLPTGSPVVTACGKRRRRVSRPGLLVCRSCVRLMLEQVNADRREHGEQVRAYVDRLTRVERAAKTIRDAAFLGAPLAPERVQIRLTDSDMAEIRRGEDVPW